METSQPQIVKLPPLKYQIGDEPSQAAVITQAATFRYVASVMNILGEEQFERCRNSFMGPLIKAAERHLQFSGKMFHCIMARNIVTQKENQLWFHFAAQPMRFSIREFHMATGLKCEGEAPVMTAVVNKRRLKFSPKLMKHPHSLKDLEEELIRMDASKVEHRFALGMLLLVESILLHKYSQYKFPVSNVQRAQDLDSFLEYPRGREAYEILLKSVQRGLNSDLTQDKYDIHGFPMAIHLWMLASVPLLQSTFSIVDELATRSSFLCQRFLETRSPTLPHILNTESSPNIKVICILPPILGDPEDSVSLPDAEDKALQGMVDLVQRGYRLTIDDWKNQQIAVNAALEQLAQESYKFSKTDSSNKDTIMAKLDELTHLVKQGFTKMGERISSIEKKMGIKVDTSDSVPSGSKRRKLTKRVCELDESNMGRYQMHVQSENDEEDDSFTIDQLMRLSKKKTALCPSNENHSSDPPKVLSSSRVVQKLGQGFPEKLKRSRYLRTTTNVRSEMKKGKIVNHGGSASREVSLGEVFQKDFMKRKSEHLGDKQARAGDDVEDCMDCYDNITTAEMLKSREKRGGDAYESFGEKKSRLEADNSDSWSFQKLASENETVVAPREIEQKSEEKTGSEANENNSSDPPLGANVDVVHIVVSPLETRQNCDDEFDVKEIYAKKKKTTVGDGTKETKTIVGDGTKEAECLVHEDEEKQRSNEKVDDDNSDESSKQRNLATEEIVLTLEARIMKVEKTLAKIREWKTIERNQAKNGVSS